MLISRVTAVLALSLGILCQASPAAPKVKLELYMESLCPFCMAFIINQLGPAYKVLSEVVDLQIVPYGNARETQNLDGTWTFTCQHGERECVGNLVETCAIRLFNDVSVSFPFILCLETSGNPDTMGPQCATQQGFDYDPIKACVNSQQGNEWQHDNAVRTGNLQPPHQGVPWIVVNGAHTDDIQNRAMTDLIGLICDTYAGPTPEACQ